MGRYEHGFIPNQFSGYIQWVNGMSGSNRFFYKYSPFSVYLFPKCPHSTALFAQTKGPRQPVFVPNKTIENITLFDLFFCIAFTLFFRDNNYSRCYRRGVQLASRISPLRQIIYGIKSQATFFSPVV